MNQCRVGLLTIAIAFLPILHGQVAGSITGKVEDASGGPISAASVTVKSLETGATRTTVTDDNGNFTVPQLAPGPQEVRVEKKGFKSAVRTGINLEVGQQAVANLRMEVGELVQQVTVSAEAPLVNATTNSVAGVVGEREIKDLPLNGRSFDNLITLNPGAINYALKSANTSTSNGNTFAVDGRRPAENIVLLNGIEYTGTSQLAITPGGVSGELLGIDAVREFNVLTDTYGAEYGKRAGAQVRVVTQSGTNSLHGTLFEFLRNSALDARNFFDQGNTFRRSAGISSEAPLGGPLKKNACSSSATTKVSVRRWRSAMSPSCRTRRRARDCCRMRRGVYSQVANLNPAMLPYMSFWPAPNGPELLSNGIASGTALSYNNPRQSIREDFGTVRTDYNLADRDSLSTSYTIDNGNNLTPNADPLFGSYETLQSQVASVTETHVISPHILNTFTAGFSRAAFNFDSVPLAQFPSSLDFVSGAGPGGITIGGGQTTTGIAAITAAGPNNAAGVYNRRNLFTYTDGVQITKGIHQISVGVWLQRMQDNENSASRQLGAATFTSLTTFLQGTTSTFQVVPNANELGWRSLFGAWYVQDAIRLRPNLTLQVGLRDEFTNGWNEGSGRGSNYIPDSTGVLQTTPRVASDIFTVNNAKHLWQPRVALAWDPFGDGKTAIRAGFGTYVSLIDDLAFLMNSLPPYNGSATFTGALSSFLPIIANTPVPPSCGPGVPTPCTTYAPQGVQSNAQTPTVEEWNFTVEREVAPKTVLRVAYVGSHGYHELLSINSATHSTVPLSITKRNGEWQQMTRNGSCSIDLMACNSRHGLAATVLQHVGWH